MEKESLLWEAQRSASIGNWEYDHEKKSLYWSKGLYVIFGFDPNTVKASHDLLISRIDSKQQNRIIEYYNQAISEGGSFEAEYTIISLDHIERNLFEKSESIYDSNGNLLRTLGTVQDITDVKLIEIQLRRSEWNLNSIVECSPNVILIIRNQIILYANYAAGQLLNEEPKKLLHRNIQDTMQILGSDNIKDVISSLSNIQSEEVGIFKEYRIQIENGEKKWVGLWGIEIFYSGDIATLVYINDITNRKESQSQLLQNEKMATIGLLAAGVAHEINNPIGYVQSNLYSLKSYQEILEKSFHKMIELFDNLDNLDIEKFKNFYAFIKDEDISYFLDDMKEIINESLVGTLKVASIVKDIKSFAHVGSESFELSDLNSIINSAINILWNKLKYNSEVVIDLVRDIPMIYCNSNQISQVLMNIILNSEQAIEDKLNKDVNYKRGLIQIKTEYLISDSKDKNNEVKIILTDNGPGIPKENLNQIFDPFFTTKKMGEGTGLGLSIVYDIIKKHNGRIEVDSELKSGTIFNIYLPIINEIGK